MVLVRCGAGQPEEKQSHMNQLLWHIGCHQCQSDLQEESTTTHDGDDDDDDDDEDDDADELEDDTDASVQHLLWHGTIPSSPKLLSSSNCSGECFGVLKVGCMADNLTSCTASAPTARLILGFVVAKV